jgi:hypothetical protein
VVSAIFVSFKICIQKVWEKEKFQDEKHDEQLYQDDYPNLLPPPAHITKTIVIQMPNLPQCPHHSLQFKILFNVQDY